MNALKVRCFSRTHQNMREDEIRSRWGQTTAQPDWTQRTLCLPMSVQSWTWEFILKWPAWLNISLLHGENERTVSSSSITGDAALVWNLWHHHLVIVTWQQQRCSGLIYRSAHTDISIASSNEATAQTSHVSETHTHTQRKSGNVRYHRAQGDAAGWTTNSIRADLKPV